MIDGRDESDGASEEVCDGKADFMVTRPFVSSDGENVVCSFDVRPAFYLGRVHRGTAELMRRFVRAAGVPFGSVAGWSVTPMCTPFYGSTAGDAEWQDRVVEAWRVSVKLSGAAAQAMDHSPGRAWYLRGWDSTVTEDAWTPGFWAGDPVDGVVIADCHAATVANSQAVVEEVAARFPRERLQVTRFPCPPFSPLVEVRILLPGLRLPDDLGGLQAAIDVCEGLGMATHESFASSLASQMRLVAGFRRPGTSPDASLAALSRFSDQRRAEPLA